MLTRVRRIAGQHVALWLAQDLAKRTTSPPTLVRNLVRASQADDPVDAMASAIVEYCLGEGKPRARC